MDNKNIIYVDADTRKAVLHSGFKVGVVNDDSCCTLTFRINKASDIDLTGLTFYVNTMSASGSGDRLDCTKEEDDQYIFIKCLLKGTIFEAKGKATINLCGREYDSNNVIVKKWGSEDITVLVGSHTEDDNAIYVEPVFKSLEELQKEQEDYEASRQYGRDEVIDILIKNMINKCNVTDDQSLKMIDYYPTAAEMMHKTASAGTIINESGKLYKVKKEHEITGTLDKKLCQKVTAVKLDTKLDTSKVNVSDIKPVDLNVQLKK